jgi:hypothetical protein
MKAMLESFIRAYAKGLFEDPGLSQYIKAMNDVLHEKINDTFNNAFTLLWNESRSGAKASNRGKSTKALRRTS